MESILYRMRDAAQQYVEVLSRIVDIDVSILDDRQMRIAGSGRMKKRTGSMVNFGNIMRHAIETKEIAVVTDPVVNALCAGCPSKDHCDNLAEIWAPILMDERVIGVIGCVCYGEKQKEKLLRNKDLYAAFFAQFASLIASQAGTLADADRRKSVQKLLEHSLSLAQIGTLILDADGKVYKINRAGREILWLDDSVPYSEISLTQDPGEDSKEYTVSFGGQKRRIVADIYHVGMDRCDRLMLFGSAELRTDLSDGILGLKPQRDLDRIVGNSAPIIRLKKNIRLIAPSPSNVLITGESGTGKELAARAIHGESLRKNGPFVAVNCAALPESLLESELFGYVKGAFTGANSSGKKGLLETAEGGTFFLDEIGDMPLPIQIKLLRVLEQREILRLGSNNPIPINVRFVFATNRDLEEMVREKTFREDFFYRINVIPLALPPLRERHGDIRLIAETFIRRFSVSMQRPCSGVSEDFWRLLESYDWPGNIRELQNVIEYAMNLLPSAGMLRSELLRNRLGQSTEKDSALQAARENTETPAVQEIPKMKENSVPQEFEEIREICRAQGNSDVHPADWNLEHMEERMIRACLARNSGKKEAKQITARELGISMATLYRKMKQYGM